MNRNLIIGLVALGIVGTGVGIYLYNKNKSPKKAGSSSKPMADAKDFDELMDATTKAKTGADIFEATPDKLLELKSMFVKNVTKDEASFLKKVFVKSEKDWTPSEKVKALEIWQRVLGRKIVG